MDFNQCIRFLESEGVRCTTQRKAILQYILKNRNHPTAMEIYKDLVNRRLSNSLANVYANLDLLEKVELIRAIRYQKVPAKYEMATEAPHCHIVCDKCGGIKDLHYLSHSETLRKAVLNDTGFRLVDLSYELRGICQGCHEAHTL
ncbi:Fur family transcriptional regulator [Shouchella patagoniensis]|uniref:Fur family transcriptional regulator n=1 Tax=Shouchella patagoniensis TaxID=228576 RepID=UPI001473F990|nr:transcriptional repressor [Shouchella patagoniensis]